MKYLIPIMTLMSLSSAWANLHLAPPDFNIYRARAIFVDFKTAHYEITYDLKKSQARVKSTITFESEKSGNPIFDLIPNPTEVLLNGEKVGQAEVKLPGDESTVRHLKAAVTPGEHVLEVENTFDENTRFVPGIRHVTSAFWIRDLKDRMFLEQYVPSNFEFDQYQITMDVKFIGKRGEQEFFTNGELTKISKDHYRIEFPEYFTVSCPYFHTSPKGKYSRLDFSYPSLSGRDVPITVYSPWKSRTRKFKAESLKILAELEADYGAWPHPGFLAYGTLPGTGGMEHSGATATSLAALDHEMLHSYFAKGIMPANGNAGWIDEAIAAWRDNGYPRNPETGFSGSNLGAGSIYQRNTDSRAYGIGSAFMAYLDWRLQDVGGLKAFLKGYFDTYKHTVITTEHFKNNLEFFSGLNLDQEFNQYIWGQNSLDQEDVLIENPIHLKLSNKQLRSLI